MRAYLNPIRRCVECLYRVGIGLSRISKITGVNKGLLHKWTRKIDSYGERRIQMANQYDLWREARESRWFAEMWLAEIDAFNLGDELNHWSDHPEAVRHLRLQKHHGMTREAKRELYQRQYQGRKADPCRRESMLLMAHLADVLAGRQQRKDITEIIGCSVLSLRHWIELQFRDGMTWENHGQHWQVDHIRPRCTFDHLNSSENRWKKDWRKHQLSLPIKPELRTIMRWAGYQ